MKPIYILNLVLAAAVVFLCIKLAGAAKNGGAEDSSEAVLDNIATRTSIRKFTDKPVDKTTVMKLLRAAMAAPTAMNRQPWHFVVVNDKNQLKALAAANPNAGALATAPMAIVVCGDMDKAIEGKGRDFWVQDASAASENLLLAAHSLGLGAVWTGTYPSAERCAAVKKVLRLPDNIIPLNTIVIGYPDENPKPKDKFREENISYNVYGGETGKQYAAETKGGLHPFSPADETRTNPFSFFTGDGLLLAAGDKTRSNAMTIGWGGLGTLWGRPAVSVYVRTGRFTHHLLDSNEYFTVMSFGDKNVLKYMGTHSGRDGDKAKALGLHTLYTAHGTPYYAEADVVIECRKMYSGLIAPQGFKGDAAREFYKSPSDGGYHTMFVGEVVGGLKR